MSPEFPEQEQANITLRLSDLAIYHKQPDEVKVLQKRFSAIEKELMTFFTRWEELETKSIVTEKST